MKSIKPLLLFILLSMSANAFSKPFQITKVVETNAHEGPVCVPFQNRLYFTSKPDFKKKAGSL